MAFLFVVLLRLLAPFFLFRFPLGGAVLVLTFDMLDYWFLGAFGDSQHHSAYQEFDKYLDLYGITFFALVVFKWKEAVLRISGLSLFLLRFTGILAFEATGMRIFLFLLPNIFENFYLLVQAGRRERASPRWAGRKGAITEPARGWQYAALVLIIAAVPKILQEYFMHYLQYPLGAGMIWREIGEFSRSL